MLLWVYGYHCTQSHEPFYTGSFSAPSSCDLLGSQMALLPIEPHLYADGCQETELHQCSHVGAFCGSQTDAIRFHQSGKETRLFKCRSHLSHAAEPTCKANGKN